MTDWFCVQDLTCSSCHLIEVYALSCLRSAGFAHSMCSTLLWHQTSFLGVQSCLCLQQLSEALNCYLPWQMSNFTKIFLISAAMSVIRHSRNNQLLGRYLHPWFRWSRFRRSDGFLIKLSSGSKLHLNSCVKRVFPCKQTCVVLCCVLVLMRPSVCCREDALLFFN